MPREGRMFGDVVDPSVKMVNRQGLSVLMTVVLESALVGALLVVPLIAADVLPTPRDALAAFVVHPPAPEPPPPPRVAPDRTPRVALNPDAAPLAPPLAITPEPPAPVRDPSPDALESVTGFVPDGAFGVDGAFEIAPPPPPPPPPRAPVRVGGSVTPPQKTREVALRYPALARSAHVEGMVIIEATIDEGGRVSDARVLRGHPLLDGEALAAVRQWEFTPTLLNGVPTAIIMTVTVNFRLQ